MRQPSGSFAAFLVGFVVVVVAVFAVDDDVSAAAAAAFDFSICCFDFCFGTCGVTILLLVVDHCVQNA